MVNTPKVITHIRDLIAKGDFENAIKELSLLFKDSPRLNDITLLSARYSDIIRQANLGIIDFSAENLVKNQIGKGLLDILNENDSPVQNAAPPTKKNKIAWWYYITALGVIIGIIAGIAQISGYSIKDTFKQENSPETFTVTVFVHGKKGKDERILKNQGQVMLGLRTNEIPCSINEKGEATFKEIPIGFKGQKVGLRIDHPQPYRCTHPDSLYLLEPNAAIYVEVALEGTNKIFGKVMDFQTEKWLDSVRVSIENIVTFTDKYGWFELNIPENKQRKFQKVTFDKKGYQNESLDSVPVHTQKEILFPLHKASKK